MSFSELTLTGSLLFRSSPEWRARFVGGVGLALQRARIEFECRRLGTSTEPRRSS